MKLNVFLICYNEELMLPYTIKHYRTRFPDCKIYIVDNYSTDNTCNIAEQSGCHIIKYDTNNQQDETILLRIRSHIYKDYVKSGWIIICDMDEWLDITDDQLTEEDANGTTVIKTQGVNMVGQSQLIDLTDIDLFNINIGYLDDNYSKNICFKYPDVSMEYWYGAHKSWPIGNPVFSNTSYFMKHYNYLGAQYLVDKYRKRYERNQLSRQKGLNGHYLYDNDKIIQTYQESLKRATSIF